MEHSQYNNTTPAGLREQTLDLDNNAYTHYRTDSQMDVGEIGPTTSLHTGQQSGFTQGFLNFLAGAPLSRQEHTADQVANEQLNFANEQLSWSNESCVSESVNHRSEFSSQSSISSVESQFEQLIPNLEHSPVEPVSHVELPNELNRPNELMREEGVPTLKDASRYINEAEWPLLGSPATVRRSGPTGCGANPSNGAGETSNDQRAGEYIVPLGVKTQMNQSGKNINTSAVTQETSFRDRTRSTRPNVVLGAWLDRLSPSELQQGMEEMERTAGNGKPPTKQSKSIRIKAFNDIDNRGQTVWWEAITLEVVGKGVTPYPLVIQNPDQTVLVPSVNQSLAKKGLTIDRIVAYRQECDGPAARLVFYPPHRACKHINASFQRSAGTRLGYAVLQPVLSPPPPRPASTQQQRVQQLTSEQ